jgi:UDP-glucose 4-epimerase
MVDLVIGGAGFIGSQLCDLLLSLGHHVVCLDNLMRGKIQNLRLASNNPNFVFIKGDANNEELLVSILRKNKVNFVYHLAANSDIQASANDPAIEFESTCGTTWHILYAMRECGVKNLFFASSSAVYGSMVDGKSFNEESALHPISYYGSAKMASEAFISAFSFMNDMNSLIFRFPNVVGKRLTHGAVFDFVSKLRLNPKELVVLGDGTQTKPYIYCDELIKAIALFAQKNEGLNTYEVGVTGTTTVRFIAENVVKCMGLSDCNIVYGKTKSGWKGDVSRFAFDGKKIAQAGWKSSMTSDEAVVQSIKDTVSNNF